MELIQMPKQMVNRGFIGWPQVYRVSRHEELPPPGVSYLIAEQVDYPLVFRLMVPILQKQHPAFDWPAIYLACTGKTYMPQRIYRIQEPNDSEGIGYDASASGPCDVTLEELAGDKATYVDLEMLTDLKMVPAFMTDIRDAITVNVTNNYEWQDGYDKKRGLCTGSLTEQPRARSLVILDISHSIPDGVSAGMLTLIKTITSVVHSDLILTGGQSYFYTVDEVKQMDIRAERKRIPRANESRMFREILATHDMDYENVIVFGDSDWPKPIKLNQRIHTKRLYSFFCKPAGRDLYGRDEHKDGAGYGRWVVENQPRVQVIHNTEWAKFFKTQGVYA